MIETTYVLTFTKVSKFFKAFTLSENAILMNRHGEPVSINIKGEEFIFCCPKRNKNLNLGKKDKDFSFYEKLYIVGLFEKGLCWKNVVQHKFDKILNKYNILEPRHFYVDINQGKVQYSVDKLF